MAHNFAQGEVSRKEKFRGALVPSEAVARAAWAMAGTLHMHLKAHRLRARMTQEAVASVLGMSHNGFSEKERGIKPLTLEELEKLAEVYGVSPLALLMAPQDGPRADLIRRAAEIARTRPASAAEAWVSSGEHIPADEKTSR